MKDHQKLMFKLSMFEQQINQLQQQLYVVEKTIGELDNLKDDLENLSGSKDKEILASIGKGIFTRAKLVSEELLVDIGGKNFVRRSIDETRKIIGQQMKKLEEVRIELEENLSRINEELTKTMGKN